MRATDVAIIGGGIIGVSAALLLAERGASVALFERSSLASGASGRNSGVVQHPFDPLLAELHLDTLALYRELSAADAGFALPDQPAGLLLVSSDVGAVRTAAAAIAEQTPGLAPAVLEERELATAEPALAPALAACRLETGYPVVPTAATLALAALAQRRGVAIRTDAPARVELRDDAVAGVRLTSGEVVPSERVLVAAGPWSEALVPGSQPRGTIRSVWGVVVSVAMTAAPAHVLEELGIEGVGRPPEALFSLVSQGADASVGSTFLETEPDPQAHVAAILTRARRYVPSLANAAVKSHRACARPVSIDGRPFVGPVPAVRGLYVCAGHGPWGVSIGPGSARLIVEQMLDGAPPVAALDPGRVSVPPVTSAQYGEKTFQPK